MAENETRQGLASIGIDVKVGTNSLNYVTGIGEIGGEPSTLDATCFKDEMAKSTPGVQKNDGFNIDYLFDNTSEKSDFRVIKGLQKARNIVPIVVKFPDGTTFTSAGYISTKTNGVKVDELIGATATVNLQSDWEITNPTDE